MNSINSIKTPNGVINNIVIEELDDPNLYKLFLDHFSQEEIDCNTTFLQILEANAIAIEQTKFRMSLNNI